jgi:hypothetical protein
LVANVPNPVTLSVLYSNGLSYGNIIEYKDGKYCETKLYDDMFSYILRKHIDDFEELDL